MKCNTLLLLLVFIRDGANALVAPNSWQKRLDRALLDVDGARNPQARFRLIQRALKDPNFQKDIASGIDAVREKGIGKGHPYLIDALWPKGTIAREDIEGIQALVKSLPERAEEFRFGSDNSNPSTSIGDVIRTLDGDVLRRTLEESLSTTVNQERSIVLAQNALRRTPKSVHALPLTDVGTIHSNDADGKSVEIRRLEESSFYSCKMESGYEVANMGNALLKLTNAILGMANFDVRSIALPFVIRDSNMYIWKSDDVSMSSASADTITTDASIESWPACTLAMIEFSGICTDGEIERQSSMLKGAIATWGDETPWKIADDSSLLVLQYNAPGTLPWRRRNQVALAIEKVVIADIVDGGDSSAAFSP